MPAPTANPSNAPVITGRTGAARRNITPNHLARLILTTVIDEGMIDAVMDDAEDIAAQEAQAA